MECVVGAQSAAQQSKAFRVGACCATPCQGVTPSCPSHRMASQVEACLAVALPAATACCEAVPSPAACLASGGLEEGVAHPARAPGRNAV
eukprot:CAMPEP_0115853916 /NCGR_PEP_ID=MMETSP0287-20121206/13751_1 /TAXON_ID=412157 /ORGANISM="Chrysochromulina rotalis, Strain UIO044" /LENGTH=89 /DNA_ID=CAMNT_0003308009 /DNA_START=733 /DNA_END=1002 /DNA_ORIENTATION=+